MSQLKSVELLSGVELLFRGRVGFTWSQREISFLRTDVSRRIGLLSPFLNRPFSAQSCPHGWQQEWGPGAVHHDNQNRLLNNLISHTRGVRVYTIRLLQQKVIEQLT
jgi:hypothetical protein